MAGGWRSVALLLSLLVILVLNSSFAHSSDVEEKYYSYESSIDNDLDFKPLVRLRREDASKDKEKSEDKPTTTGKKPTVPAKDPGSKISSVGKSKSKKVTADSTSVESPSSITSSSNATVTTTTTNITTTTTTTTSPPIIINSSIPVNTSAAPTSPPSEDEPGVKNSTVMAMPAEKVPESTTMSAVRNDTGEGLVDNKTDIKSIDKGDSQDDPDSGDDQPPSIEGLDTKNTTVDHHRYYKSLTVKGDEEAQRYWIDLDRMKQEVVLNEMLSDSHRRAATVTLTFDFPFYGHMLRNITIATGGFLFTGEFVHTWLAATQYIAPLMANFDTSVSEDACVKYADNGTAFTVQWNNVKLKDHLDAGTFTFQATLHKTGDITFIYKQIPVMVTNIGDDQHPVKVGLSDAYIVDRTVFYIRRKTIYEYHKIDMKKSSLIGNWTAIVFTALPTCMSMQTCDACLATKISFQCAWCNDIGRCSNGLDRHRQDWMSHGCEQSSIQDIKKCAGLAPPPTYPAGNPDSSVDTFGRNASVEHYTKATGNPVLDASEYKEGIVSDGEPDTLAHTSGRGADDENSGVGGVVAVIFIVGLVLGIGGWVAYAYFYPHSTSGQMLIKYRPSTWSWRRGEARYTAAAIHSIHM